MAKELGGFTYDVFLSHSAQDKAVVRAVAERLGADGLRVWFDEWEIRPDDSLSPRERARVRAAKIEDGLEHSRVRVLSMSAHAFGSDWAQLEAGTYRLRDPLNKASRFIPPGAIRFHQAIPEGSKRCECEAPPMAGVCESSTPPSALSGCTSATT